MALLSVTRNINKKIIGSIFPIKLQYLSSQSQNYPLALPLDVNKCLQRPKLATTNLTPTSSPTIVKQHKCCNNLSTIRYYSTGGNKNKPNQNNEDESSSDNRKPDTDRSLPKFSDEPIIYSPSIFYSLKNWITSYVIRRQCDPDFSQHDFIAGSKQALETVSQKLAAGEFDALHGLVHERTIDRMKQIVNPMTPAQRQQIAIDKRDIGFAFIRDVKIITKENNTRVFVEIKMVYHVVTGMSDLVESMKAADPPKFPNIGILDENLFVINYTFLKEFTKGVDDDWIVTDINHVKISDQVLEQQNLLKEYRSNRSKNDKE